jgi:acetyl-CoA carboxylase biotin carboxyl carrier protein
VSVDGTDALQLSAGVSAAELSELLALIAGSDITELDLTLGATRLSLRRPSCVPDDSAQHEPSPEQAATSTEPLAIASPLVGIFRPAVVRGDSVTPGQSIGAIEALGMPTSVDAPQSGTVEDVLVQDGSPVEYGQPLLVLRRDSHEA